MAEIVTGPLAPPPGIAYSDRQMETMQSRYSRMKPIEPGDVCCNCGLDCDGAGFSVSPYFTAFRIRGHPLCARATCYEARRAEFAGLRNSCKCGARQNSL